MPPVHAEITLGHKLRSARAGDIAVHEVAYRAGEIMPPHAHDRSNMTFVLAGLVEETARGEAMSLGVCDGVIKPAGTVHSNRCGPRGMRSVVVEFDDERSDQAVCAGAGYSRLHGPVIARLGLRLLRLLRERPPMMAEDLRETIIEAMASAAVVPQRTSRREAPWMVAARAALHDGFGRPVRVHDVAAMLQLHPVYLARAFRQRHGCSVSMYRRRLQLCAAARLLANGDEPLAMIALRCGFADQSHLTRAFRAALGVPPGEYRQRLRG